MRPKRAGNKFERADFVTERANLLLERADSESERARIGPVRPGGIIYLGKNIFRHVYIYNSPIINQLSQPIIKKLVR